MKRVISLLLALLLCSALLPVFAAGEQVADEVGYLSSSDLEQVDAAVHALYQEYGIRAWFWFTESEDPELAPKLEAKYRELAGDENGILVAVDTGAGLWAARGAGSLSDLTDDERNALYQRYYEGATHLDEVLDTLAGIQTICEARATVSSAPAEPSGDHVIDDTGALSSTDVAEINAQAEDILARYGVNAYFWLASVEDSSVGSLLPSVYQMRAGDADGIIMAFDVRNNKWSVYAAGKLADVSESEEDSLYDQFAKGSNYYGGIRNYLTELDAICRLRFGGESYPRLFDGADLLTEAEEAALLNKLDEISARQGCDVAVTTTTGTHGYSVQEYADDFYDYHGYKEDGVLLLISMAERDWYISTKGYCMTAINDDGWPYIGDQITPQLSDGDYYDAFVRYAELCDDFITHARTDAPYTRSTLPKEPLSFTWVLVAAAIGLIVGGMVTGSMKGKLKSVRWQPGANQYLRQNSLQLKDSRDTFLYSTLTKTEIPRESSSRSGGGGYHSSSSGSSHGGGGGKF